MPTLVSIGDGIIDAVELTPGKVERFPGGAALNLAVGAARLGLTSRLVTRYGRDRNGFLLDRYLREEGVEVLNPPNVDFTGVVRSTRRDGEPTYHFAPAMFRRRILFSDAVLEAVASADAVAVNSFPFDNPREVEALVAALRRAAGLVIVDPNPRPNLIADRAAYRAGAERAMAVAAMAKLSDEDAALLYDGPARRVAERLLAMGVEAVLLTHGSAGASVSARGGLASSVPVARTEGPVVDTMGAGDAALATVIAFILNRGMPSTQAEWHDCLTEAMRVAAATCARPGGSLVLPKGLLAARQRSV
jgi:fructokinase